MLIVHPSSQCDVCLDPYTWSTPTKTPHAIQCGHVFCHGCVLAFRLLCAPARLANDFPSSRTIPWSPSSCLRTVSPSNCPLCRKAFNPERIKKLHVDRPPTEGTALAGSAAEESEFMYRAGMLFTEGAEQADVNALVEEVMAWLSQRTSSTVRPSSDHSCCLRSCGIVGSPELTSRTTRISRFSINHCAMPSLRCTSTRRCRCRRLSTTRPSRRCARLTSGMLTSNRMSLTSLGSSSRIFSLNRKRSGRNTRRECSLANHTLSM